MKRLPILMFIIGLLILSNCNENELTPPAKPNLVSPTDGTSDTELSLTFNWDAVQHAEGYSFQLSSSIDFTDTENNSNGISGISLSVNELMPSTKYYWRVNAKNSAGLSPWSDVWEFTTKPVGVPTLKSPENNSISTENQATLEWNSVVDADSYAFQVSLASDFSSTVLNKENQTSTDFSITELDWNSKYYWRVRASINSCYSEWSETWSFVPKRPIPTVGLVAHYPFNGNANDESGNGHDGSIQGPILSNDRNGNSGKAYSFDGTDDHILVPHNDALNLIGDFTISAWYKSDGCSTPCGTYHTIINKRDVSTGSDDWPWGLAISYVDGPKNEFKKIIAHRRNNSSLDYSVSKAEIQLNTWQHIVVVVKDDTQSIYIDGELEDTYAYTVMPSSNSKSVIIGWNFRPGLEQFKGLIDDIRLYNRALTIDEIQALFEE